MNLSTSQPGRAFLVGVACYITLSSAKADSFSLVDEPVRGRVKFVFVGASLVDNIDPNTGQPLSNGVSCLKPSATAVVQASDLSLRPTLKKAILYYAGSLIGDDGTDYASAPTEIFVTGNLRADNAADKPFVEAAARAAADNSVTFLPPGAPQPITVTASAQPYVTVNYKPSGSEQGNVGFFLHAVDVTNVILNQGGGVLAGSYTVGELRADVCLGTEAVCASPGDPPVTCENTSQIHTNGTASFALLLIFEDQALPLHSVSVFQGLQDLAGTTLHLNLTGQAVSDPSSGALATYVLEGDQTLGVTNPGQVPCDGPEYIEVDGDADPTQNGMCLSDDDNPLGNVFNGTINVQPPTAAAPICSDPLPEHCCIGDGQCPVTGVDIDRYNISSALIPGNDTIRVSIGTGSDRIAVGTVVLGVDIFSPVLDVDSQIRVLNAVDGYVRLGGPVTYSIAVSNTGNITADNVSVELTPPASSTGLRILKIPEGARDLSSSSGGTFGNGAVHVDQFSVERGKIAEVRFELLSTCGALSQVLQPSARIGATDVNSFDISAPAVAARGPGILGCAGLDEEGPFVANPLLNSRVLRGGGCSQVAPTLSIAILVFFILRYTHRRWMRP